MKLVITIVKQHVAENVHYFTVSDSLQELFLKYNDDTEETIHLQNETENWIFLSINFTEVPLKVKL